MITKEHHYAPEARILDKILDADLAKTLQKQSRQR